MRLRRFLITEPMGTSLVSELTDRSESEPRKIYLWSLADLCDGRLNHRLYCRFRDAERAAKAHRWQFARVYEPVDGHARYAHHLGDLGHRKETHC
jgi:hypothetical protein